jgi:thiosulfate dehydrogenase (quinone) large subunit
MSNLRPRDVARALLLLLAAFVLGSLMLDTTWGIIAVVIAAVGWFLTRNRPVNEEIAISEPRWAHRLFHSTLTSPLWLVLRVLVGWEWLEAGWHKFNDPAWHSGAALLGYWTRAVAIPEKGKPAITYGWYRGFLEGLISIQANEWFTYVIMFGEILVGLGMIVGCFVGIAAFFGALMNQSFMLAGSASTNPVLFAASIALILAWRNAGWLGLDRWVLPALGTPWQRGKLLGGDVSTTVVPEMRS